MHAASCAKCTQVLKGFLVGIWTVWSCKLVAEKRNLSRCFQATVEGLVEEKGRAGGRVNLTQYYYKDDEIYIYSSRARLLVLDHESESLKSPC